MNLKDRAKKLKIDIPAVYIALKKKETPLRAKILAGITIAYALSPVDLIPDFIPVIGLLDDLVLLPVLISLTLRLIPEDILDSCRKEAEDLWKDGKPKRSLFAIPIILIWVVILAVILKAVWNHGI